MKKQGGQDDNTSNYDHEDDADIKDIEEPETKKVQIYLKILI